MWDGLSASGELVQAASDYTAVAVVRDAFGNESSRRGNVPVDVFIVREDGKMKIKISSIHFEANKANYKMLEQDKVTQNLETLDRLAQILKKFSGYHIEIEGYCVQEYWRWPDRAKWEQENELLPLSRARARVIKEALVGTGHQQRTYQHGGLRRR